MGGCTGSRKSKREPPYEATRPTNTDRSVLVVTDSKSEDATGKQAVTQQPQTSTSPLANECLTTLDQSCSMNISGQDNGLLGMHENCDQKEKQEGGDSVLESVRIVGPTNVDGKAKVNDDIVKVYDQVDEDGVRTSVLRSAYTKEKSLSEDDTVGWIRSELFDILRRELCKPASTEEAVQMIQRYTFKPNVDDHLLSNAIELVRTEHEQISNMADLSARMLRLKSKSSIQWRSNGLMNSEEHEYDETELKNCLRMLSRFAEEKASIKSLLKVMHRKLNDQNQTLLDGDICRRTDRNSFANPFADMQLSAKEHENVELIVRKSVKKRPITWEELKQRGIKPEDLEGKKEMYILTPPPKGLDEAVREKAEQMMLAAGTIIHQPSKLVSVPATTALKNVDNVFGSDVKGGNPKEQTIKVNNSNSAEDVNEIVQILKDHLQFCSTVQNDFDDLLDSSGNSSSRLQNCNDSKNRPDVE